MRGYMFRNPWLALLFVGMTLMSVAALIGTDDDKGTLVSAADTIGHQRDPADPAPRESSRPTAEPKEQPAPTVTTFADEGDLIDSAEGSDPTPVDEPSADATPTDAPSDTDPAG